MMALLAGICIKSDYRLCAAGSYQIKPIYLLSAGFALIAIIGILGLGGINRRR